MKAIERIMEALKDKGLAAHKIEKDLDISNGYLGTVFKRKGDMGETILIKIANYFNFSLKKKE